MLNFENAVTHRRVVCLGRKREVLLTVLGWNWTAKERAGAIQAYQK